MHRARWNRPSCLVMLALALALLLVAAVAWFASGELLRTPSPTAIPKETQTYDTDVPQAPGSGD